MTDKEKSINDALNDIFGDDFLEFDTNNEENINIKPESNITFENYNEENSTSINNPRESTDEFKENNVSNIIEEKINNDTPKDIIFENYTQNNFNDVKQGDEVFSDENSNINQSYIGKKNKSKKYLTYIIIGIVFAILIILSVIKLVSSIERKEYCYYEANDDGYSLTDEYTISYKGNKLLYVEGIYSYSALKDEYKSQIEYIKNEKLPVIINSNGMKGFTHIYEIGENSLKINSYYDVTLMDFDLIDKNDNKINPISYINLKSNVTYKNLKKNLEKNGYKCTLSK